MAQSGRMQAVLERLPARRGSASLERDRRSRLPSEIVLMPRFAERRPRCLEARFHSDKLGNHVRCSVCGGAVGDVGKAVARDAGSWADEEACRLYSQCVVWLYSALYFSVHVS